MNDYRLKLSSKKLSSGKCQVRFELLDNERPSYYGYLLSDGKAPLSEVIDTIYRRARMIEIGDTFHEHLFHLEKKDSPQEPLFLFKN